MSGDNFKNPWGDDNNKGPKDYDDIEDMIKKGQEKVINLLNAKQSKNRQGGGGGRGLPPNFNLQKLIPIGILVVAVIWLSTGFYTIQPDEEGVVMRFGKYSRTAVSGLNYKLPTPIEKVIKISVTRVNKEEIGFRSGGQRFRSREQWLENRVSQESQMLTGDENIIDINFEVQWVINDAHKYLFNVRELRGESTVRSAAESAMREVVGLTGITEVLAEERSRVEKDTMELLQSTLDDYNIGIKILRVQLLRVEPPPLVIDAYRDVQSAKADKEREINQAQAYRNDIIPRARGEVEKLLQGAEGYKEKVVADAKGQAERFRQVYNQYVRAKDVTRKRMYLETMEKVLEDMDKVIIDKGVSKGVLPYMPLNEMMKNKK